MNGWDYTADVCLGLGCKWTFNGDISQWNTGGVTKMETMFYNASAFDQDISKWDTSQVTDMGWMFGDDVGSAFNQDIARWNTAQVLRMNSMFSSAPAFNQDIGSWNTARVTDMGFMFYQASAFNHDIGSWNTSQVISMRSMFESAPAFNQDIGSWNTAQVLRMNSMFSSAPAFNQDIGSWNTAQVTDMNVMFESASAFNHDISSWTGSAATSAQTDMFSGATAFQAKFACTNADNGPASSCEGPSPIPDASWHDFVGDCLAESAAIGETGECIVWARSKDVWYGTMPNWDVSLVTDMHGYPETGEGEKGEFVAKLLARALAGDVEDKRFVVLIGETNSGKGCLTQLLGDCFGLGTFVGNYQSKNLQGESPTLSWLLQNKNCRIILANEINTERPILANNIRMCASGGEPITALAKYKNEENFISQATMFLFCNEMPEIKGNDDGDAVKNRMVYVETEYSYLEKQKYEEMKNTKPKVRLADPTLKSEYLKRKEIQEAFVSLVCGAYVLEAPPLPECCIKKSLEYKPNKSLKKRLENIIDFTGDENDYVPFSDIYELFSGSETPKKVGDALTKMSITSKNKRIEGKLKNCRLGIKLKDFENITEEYGDDTSAELSFASTDAFAYEK